MNPVFVVLRMNIQSVLMKSKKEIILATTLELLTKQGFHASPVSQISREAGMAAGTIYHYFQDKNELIRAVYKDVKKQMGQAMMNGFDKNNTIRDQFFVYWKNLYQYFVQHPLQFAFLEQYHHSTFINQETQKESKHYYQPVLDFFEAGMNQKVFKDMGLSLVSELVYGNIATTARLVLNEEISLTARQLDEVVEASWDSIKQEK